MCVCVWMEKQEGKNDNSIHRYSRDVREERGREIESFSLHIYKYRNGEEKYHTGTF